MPREVGRLYVTNDTSLTSPQRAGFDEVVAFEFSADSMPVSIDDNTSASDAMNVTHKSSTLENGAALYAIDRIGSFNKTYPGSKRLSFQGRLTGIDLEALFATTTLDSGLQTFNIEVTSRPGDPTALLYVRDVLRYWETLANRVGPSMFNHYGASILAQPLPGFRGNLWDNIKQYCAANRLQLYSMLGGKYINNERPQIRALATAKVKLSSKRTEPVRALDIAYYNYTQVTNGLFFAADQVYSLGAGEVQTFDVPCNGYPVTLNQPVPVTGISPYPYTSGTGQYVVTGSDGYIVAPAFWTDNGGSIKVAPHVTDPNQITVTITAPANTTRAPYRISEGGADRPALYITGTGVTMDRQTVRIQTGYVGPAQELDEIDNKFVSTKEQAFNLGSEAAYRRCGATLTATINTTVEGIMPAVQPSSLTGDMPSLESLPGSVVRIASGMHTIKSVSIDGMEQVTLQTEHTTTVGDFNTWWAGKTIADFNAYTAAIGADMTAFAMQPLMRLSTVQPL